MIARPALSLLAAWCVLLSGFTDREAAAQARPRPAPAVAFQRLDSLEQAALTGATFADRSHAVITIGGIATAQGDCNSAGTVAPARYPGVVRRLASIYQRTNDEALRHVVLDVMLWQTECDEVTAFLARVAESASDASSAGHQGYHAERLSPQAHAIDVLVALGVRGQSVLQQLHASGNVRDNAARASLNRLSETGFRRPPARP